MSLTVSRLTAVLAALALIAVAGTFWWAIRARLEMKAAVASSSRQDRPPQKLTGRISRDSRPTSASPGPSAGFELAGRSAPIPSAPMASAPAPSAPPPAAVPPADTASAAPPPPPPGVPGPASSGAGPPASRGLDLPAPQLASLPGGGATMPLPSLALLMPPSDPAPAPPKFTEPAPAPPPQPPAAAAAAPSPPPAPAPDPPRRRARAAAAPAAAPAAPPPGPRRSTYYMEKYFELGEYHYRRRPCEPPNMPDVCFMPQGDREPIVVVSKP